MEAKMKTLLASTILLILSFSLSYANTDHIVPYLIGNKDGWWAGVDIYNHSNSSVSVLIKIQRHSDGVISKEQNISIAPFRHYVITPDFIEDRLYEVDGRASVIVRGPDDLMLTAFHGINGSDGVNGFGILPIYKDSELKN